MPIETTNTSISPGFDNESEDSSTKGQLKITRDWGFRWGTLYQIRVWPATSNVTVMTNYGIVVPVSAYHQASGQEYVTFSNSDTGSTQYPIVAGSASQAGPALDSNGNIISVSFTIENGQLKASQKFYGGAIVTYTSTYNIWSWQPPSPGETWWNYRPDSFNYAIQILAFHEGATATHTVSFGVVQSDSFREAYRVTSEYIADSEGQWEVPPNWPEDNEYPFDNEEGPDVDSYQQLERTHEIMTVRLDSSTFIDRQWVTHEQPYSGSNLSYEPEYKFTKGSGTGDWEEAFLNIGWNEIETRLKNEYSGITGF